MYRCAVLVSIAAVLAAGPASAGARHHHSIHMAGTPRLSASQEPYAGTGSNPYAGYNGPGSAVLNATVRAEREPGVTLELAPDAKETATGGPVGGVPGFDGS